MTRDPVLGRGIRAGVRRLFQLPSRSRAAARDDADAELEAFLAARVERLVARGMTPDAARAEALRRLGAPLHEVRDALRASAARREQRTRLLQAIEELRQDVRYAMRQLAQRPGFTATVIFTLALGIGANTAIFSVVHRLLLDPLPYPDGNRIVMLTARRDDVEGFPSVATLRVLDARARSVATVAAVSVVGVAVQEDGGQDTVYAFVTPNYLTMLGIEPSLGRAFTSAEGWGEGAPVAMISYARWQREFGGRADAIGSTVEVDYDRPDGPERRQYTIVGVTPPSMALPMSPAAFNKNLHEPTPGVWLPLDLSRWSAEAHPNSYARLRPGQSVEDATRELQGIIDSSPELGGSRPRMKLLRARDMLEPSSRRTIEVLFAAVGVLLLIACANVASLLMSRAWARRREFAIRAGLGAGRGRLAQQVLTESTLLALAGGLVGLVVAWQMLHVIIALRPPALASLDDVRIDRPVLLWSVGISVLTGILFGTLPALFAARGSVATVLRSEGRGGGGSTATRQVRSALIVFEIALSLVLLVGAGLLVRSLGAMQRIPLGFEPRGLVSFDLIFNPRTPRDPQTRAALRNQILEQLRAVPGVADAAIGMLPAAGFGGLSQLSTDPDAGGVMRSVPEFSTIFVGPNYFRVAGVRLLEGRVPDSLATSAPAAAGVRPVSEVVVNRGLAARFWPDGGALGARLHEQSGAGPGQSYVVVGIADDVQMPGPTRLARSAVLYQAPRFASFIVRTATRDVDLVPALRRAITSVRPTPFIQTTTIGEVLLRDSLAPTRFAMALLTAFAGVALVLAAVGLYGVIAYGVAQRAHEIGVRVALGARPGAIVARVVAGGLRLAAVGVALGAVLAVATSRVLGSLLYGVNPADPVTFVAITLLVVAIALVASYVPARRALRIEPIEALRAE